jgi:hypothetical protein
VLHNVKGFIDETIDEAPMSHLSSPDHHQKLQDLEDMNPISSNNFLNID